MKEQILEYLSGQQLCTIASADDSGNPQAAFVAFSEDENLRIFFGTSNQTRKYKNILNKSNIAIVVADFKGEVQYEGLAKEITDSEYRKEVESRHLAKVPGAQKFADDPNQTYFEIIPTWIRFTRHGEPDIIEEITEF